MPVDPGGPRRRGPDIMWSPWRMTYISAEHTGGHAGPSCVFCDLPGRRDDQRTYILYRGARAFVIMNLYPYNNGHLMVVPYAHVDSISALDGETLTEMMGLAQRSQAVLSEAMRPQGVMLSPGPCTPRESGVCLDILSAALSGHGEVLGQPARIFRISFTGEGSWEINVAPFKGKPLDPQAALI